MIRFRIQVGAVIFFALTVLILSRPGPAQESRGAAGQDKAGQAKSLDQQAKDMLNEKFDAQTLAKGLEMVEQATRLAPDDDNLFADLAWLYWQYGDWLPRETSQQKAERIRWFEKGEKAADQAMKINRESVAGLYWKTTNMASAADMKGWIKSLWMAPTLFSNMDKIDALDPHYEMGATDRFWSEVLCRVPLFLAERFGHTVEEVVISLDEEIKLEPRYFGNRVYIARLYQKKENKEKALEQLEYVITHNPEDLPAKKAENRTMQAEAKKMWKEYTGKDYPDR